MTAHVPVRQPVCMLTHDSLQKNASAVEAVVFKPRSISRHHSAAGVCDMTFISCLRPSLPPG